MLRKLRTHPVFLWCHAQAYRYPSYVVVETLACSSSNAGGGRCIGTSARIFGSRTELFPWYYDLDTERAWSGTDLSGGVETAPAITVAAECSRRERRLDVLIRMLQLAAQMPSLVEIFSFMWWNFSEASSSWWKTVLGKVAWVPWVVELTWDWNTPSARLPWRFPPVVVGMDEITSKS